jgi:excisionase family DNA binding protein
MSKKKKPPITSLPDPLPHFLELPEVAFLLRVSERTLYDWVSQGKIPYRKAGSHTIFDRDEILAWTKPKASE